MVLAEVTYLLCAATALMCCVLLGRAYTRGGGRLLLWGSLCFGALTLDNALLFVDRVALPLTDIALWRLPSALIGACFLLYGLIWETK